MKNLIEHMLTPKGMMRDPEASNFVFWANAIGLTFYCTVGAFFINKWVSEWVDSALSVSDEDLKRFVAETEEAMKQMRENTHITTWQEAQDTLNRMAAENAEAQHLDEALAAFDNLGEE